MNSGISIYFYFSFTMILAETPSVASTEFLFSSLFLCSGTVPFQTTTTHIDTTVQVFHWGDAGFLHPKESLGYSYPDTDEQSVGRDMYTCGRIIISGWH